MNIIFQYITTHKNILILPQDNIPVSNEAKDLIENIL